MASELFHVAGTIEFSGRLRGTRAEIENRLETMMMELCLTGKEKNPDLLFNSKPIALYQKLSGFSKV